MSPCPCICGWARVCGVTTRHKFQLSEKVQCFVNMLHRRFVYSHMIVFVDVCLLPELLQLRLRVVLRKLLSPRVSMLTIIPPPFFYIVMMYVPQQWLAAHTTFPNPSVCQVGM
jgi:hypothetical protein